MAGFGAAHVIEVLGNSRPMGLSALKRLLEVRLKETKRLDFIADMLWVIGSGRRLPEHVKPFSEAFESASKSTDSRTGEDILSDIHLKIRGRLN